MSQQEMGFDDAHYESEHTIPPRISNQYGQYQQSAQKLRPRAMSKKVATRIQLWTAYTSLLLAMILAFILGGNGLYEGIYLGVLGYDNAGAALLISYIIIIAVNLFVFLFLNFKVTVTRKPIQ